MECIDNPTNCVTNNVTPSRLKMSSSLKEKLKRLGRYHGFSSPRSSRNNEPTSTMSTPTRSENSAISISPLDVLQDHSYVSSVNISNTTCNTVNSSNGLATSPHPSCPLTPNLYSPALKSVDESGGHMLTSLDDSLTSLHAELKQLQSQVKEKEELLRKLKLVKLYRAKNNLVELQSMIKHWRTACQAALLDFQNKLQDPKPSLVQLMQSLQIDFSLIRYNVEEETFETESS